MNEKFYRCASSTCPGLPWKASERPHPPSCNVRESRPLISDATLAKIVRLTDAASLDPRDSWRIVGWFMRRGFARALDEAKLLQCRSAAHDMTAHDALIATLEEANEEAVRNNAADDLLDPTKTSEADVDAGLRAMGVDPVALAERGLASVRREQLRKAIRDYLNAPLQPANSVMREAAESFFGEDFDR